MTFFMSIILKIFRSLSFLIRKCSSASIRSYSVYDRRIKSVSTCESDRIVAKLFLLNRTALLQSPSIDFELIILMIETLWNYFSCG